MTRPVCKEPDGFFLCDEDRRAFLGLLRIVVTAVAFAETQIAKLKKPSRADWANSRGRAMLLADWIRVSLVSIPAFREALVTYRVATSIARARSRALRRNTARARSIFNEKANLWRDKLDEHAWSLADIADAVCSQDTNEIIRSALASLEQRVGVRPSSEAHVIDSGMKEDGLAFIAHILAAMTPGIGRALFTVEASDEVNSFFDAFLAEASVESPA